MSEEEFDVYETLVEKTIRLHVKKDEFGLSGYEFDDKGIEVLVNQTTYNKFEIEAEKFGLSVDEALATLLYGRLRRLNDC